MPYGPLEIRRLTAPDAPAYRDLMLEAYEHDPDAYTSSVAERAALPLAWWEHRLGGDAWPVEWVAGATLGGVLVGTVGLSFEARTKTRHKAGLFGMYVRPDARGAGVGEALVRAVLAQARGTPAVRLVQLTVTEGNALAQRLYERCGFHVYGVEPMAVALQDRYAGKVLMWCPLDPAPNRLESTDT